MEAYKRVAAARAKGRPTGSDFIEHIFEGFVELHGDRRFADDKAIVAGVAMLNDMPVTVIAIDRGKDTKEKIKRNFGSAHPEGYRKALRQMKLAEKFKPPGHLLHRYLRRLLRHRSGGARPGSGYR